MRYTFKKSIRDIVIAAATLTGASKIRRMLRRKKGPLVRAIVFHDVGNALWFERMLAHLKKHYSVLSPEDFLTGRFDAKKINILITFDDGYTSWTNTCAPLLATHGIYGIFFLNSGLLEAKSDQEAQQVYVRDRLLLSPRHTLSWEGAKDLQSKGHMLGGHTKNHIRLSSVNENEQHVEIEEDRTLIGSHSGHAPLLFAYPFGRKGDYTEKTKTIVQTAGYTHAFTTESSFIMPDCDKYEIPRLCLENDLSEEQLERWIEGGYDVYAAIKNLCAR